MKDIDIDNIKRAFVQLLEEHQQKPLNSTQRADTEIGTAESLAEYLVEHTGMAFTDAYEKLHALGAEQENIQTFKIAALNMMDKLQLARTFIKQQPMYYDDNKMWWQWNHPKKCWQHTDETNILIQISKCTTDLTNTTIVNKTKNELIESLKQAARDNKPKTPPSTWIQISDTIIDIKNGEYYEATPNYFISNPIPHKLVSQTETPNIDKLFEEWVGKENVIMLKEICAYCMLPDHPIHRLFCLNGSGLNGKGCFQRVLEILIGGDNVTSTELDYLLKNRFEMSRIYKKLLVLMGEVNIGVVKNTARLKSLTGQDLIPIEFKNKQPFEFRNYAKIIINTNSLPITLDKTDGFYRRWTIIDFPNRFDETKDVMASVPEEEYDALASQCVIILKSLYERREFTNQGSIEDRRAKYESLSNPIMRFVNDFCVKDVSSCLEWSEFVERLEDYLNAGGHRLLTSQEVKRVLSVSGFEKKKQTKDGKPTNWLWGLKWANSQRKTKMTIKTESILSYTCGKGVGNPSFLSSLSFDLVTDIRNFTESKGEPIDFAGIANLHRKRRSDCIISDGDVQTVIDSLLSKGEIVMVKPDKYLTT